MGKDKGSGACRGRGWLATTHTHTRSLGRGGVAVRVGIS